MSNVYNAILKDNIVPEFVTLDYSIDQAQPFDIEERLSERLRLRGGLVNLKKGASVAVACGSREINNLSMIVRRLVHELKNAGLKPFIVPAMGSHGGATAEGQQAIIESYGITEAAMGAPICSSMETVLAGQTEDNIPVHIDGNAFNADYIIPVGRIKPHTDFHGTIESGLMKMLAIGLGKQKGASLCHERGFPRMSENIRKIGQVILKKKNIPFGVAILEDAHHNTFSLSVVPGNKIEAEEPILLIEAKRLVPRIPFENIDVLLISEMGKNISGPGMDPNVTGRSLILGRTVPYAKSIAVLDLTDKSHHNANGIGCADVTTQRLIDKMDPVSTFPNGITVRDPDGCRIPMYMPNDELAIKLAIHFCNLPKGMEPKIVWIKNTLTLNRFCVSLSLIGEAETNLKLKVQGNQWAVPFDETRNTPSDFWDVLLKG